ncbi:MFS transporter [Streptomyces sp. NPDC099050]|uniref:MFS transporter n=1 Tax=Streptomyces sp. NPDC099050 TaxID=3366100 RepID=UPI0037F522DE
MSAAATRSPYQRTPGRLPAVLLMAGSCLPVLGAVLLAPVLPRMRDHFEGVPGSGALVPLILTVPALSIALLAPFAGVLVDRLGRKRLLLVATVMYSIFGTAPLWLESLHGILVSRFLVGIAEAAIMTACTTLIGDYYSGEVRDRYLALQTMCASVSATFFFVLGGVLGSASWRAPFWLYAVGLLIAPAMARALPTPIPTSEGDLAHAHAHAHVPPAKGAFSVWRMAGICVLTVFGAVVFYTVPVEMAFLLDGLDVDSTGAIGAVTAAASAATVLGSIVFTRLPARRRQSLWAFFGVCAAGFLIMGTADSLPLLVAGAVLNCIGTGLLLPALVTRAMSGLGFSDRGRGMGLWTAAFFLGEFLCPLVLLGGEMAAGSLAMAVALLALLTALVSAALATLTRRRPVPEAVPAAQE